MNRAMGYFKNNNTKNSTTYDLTSDVKAVQST